MAVRPVSRGPRAELWFWRVCAVVAVALLVSQLTAASSTVAAARPEAGLEPELRRPASSARHGAGEPRPSPRSLSLLASLERARSTSTRCQAIERLSRLPDLDEQAVAKLAGYLEPGLPLELRLCAAYGLGNVAHEGAFEPLRALAQGGELATLREAALVALAMRPDRASRQAALELSQAAPRGSRVAVAVALADAGALEAMPLLAELLAGGGIRDRERLLMALGKSGDPRAVGVLQGYLAQGNRNTQFSVLYALGEIGGRAATETLLHVLDERPELAAQAASALARTGSEEAREALLALAEEDASHGVGQSALSALAELDGEGVRELMQRSLGGGPAAQGVAMEYFVSRQDEAVVAQLAELVRAGSMQSGVQALSALSRLGSEQALDVLEQAAAGQGPLASSALSLLGQSGAQPERARRIALAQAERGNYAGIEVLASDDSAETRAALRKAATEGEAGVASRALWELSQHSDPEARSVIEHLAESGDPQKRSSALWALAQSGDPKVVDTLRGALSDRDEGVRRQAVQALSQLGGGAQAEAALLAASRDASSDVLAAAASSLGALGTPAALQRLEELARAPATASHGLLALANSAPARAEPLAAQLIASADPAARRAALSAAFSLPGEASSQILVGALHDRDPELVREAIELVAGNYQTEPVRAALRELSQRELPDDLKQRAAQLEQGGAQGQPMPEPIFY